MMTLNTCKTAVAVILLVLGACDAFVVDIAPSKPALLTRILNHNGAYNNADPLWWENKSPFKHGGVTPGISDIHKNLRRKEVHPVKPKVSPREQQLELQIDELKTKLGRMSAQQQNTQIFVTLLDVSDNLARALEAVPAEEKKRNDALKTLCEGIQMTEKGLDQVFEMSGIVKYGEVGEPFDHNIHHALCEFPDPEKEPDTIGHIIKAGYLLNERVLRYAEVAVVRSEPSPSKSCELAY